MHGSHLYDIRMEEKIFAWEKATASYLNLDDEALNRCIQAGSKYFCNKAKVVMQGLPQTCLAAVWLQERNGIKLMCHLWSRPAISSARKINSTHTVVKAPEDTEDRVQCPESPKLVRENRGQWWLAMSAAAKCQPQVGGSLPGIRRRSRRRQPWSPSTPTSWHGQEKHSTSRWKRQHPLQSITSNILQALRESESNLPVTMLVAIRVAARAVVVVTSFIIITYVKFKMCSATSRNSGVSKAAIA
jgi:hypothetical protein